MTVVFFPNEAKGLMDELHVQAILGGPHSWEESTFVAELSTRSHVPLITTATNDVIPSASSRWPFLVHMHCSHQSQVKAVAAIVKSYQWRRVVVIYQDHGYIAKDITLLSDSLQEENVQIEHHSILPTFASQPDLRIAIQKELIALKSLQCRVFIVHSTSAIATPLFTEATLNGMMAKDYVWITTNSITSLLSSVDDSIVSSMQGVIGVGNCFPHLDERFKHFRNRFRHQFWLQYPNEDNPEPGVYALQAYDATRVVSHAMSGLRKVLQSNNTNMSTGQRMLDNILSTNLSGLCGKIHFSEGRLVQASTLQIVNVVGRSYRELGFWYPETGLFSVIDKGEKKSNASMKIMGNVFWPGGTSSIPRGWATPTNIARPMKIGVPANNQYEKFVKVNFNATSNETTFTGFSIDVFQMVVQQLPYDLPYEFIPYLGTYDSLVEQVHLKVS